MGLEDFVMCLEQQKLHPASIGAVFEFVVYHSIGRNIYKAYPELEGFSGIKHEKRIAEFINLDKDLISLNGKSFAYEIGQKTVIPEGSSGYRASERTEMQRYCVMKLL